MRRKTSSSSGSGLGSVIGIPPIKISAEMVKAAARVLRESGFLWTEEPAERLAVLILEEALTDQATRHRN